MLWDLLEVEKKTGIEITESFAMYPTAAVSGWYFSHTNSRYFGLGKINKDRVHDSVKRTGMEIHQMERWLAPNLDYDRDASD